MLQEPTDHIFVIYCLLVGFAGIQYMSKPTKGARFRGRPKSEQTMQQIAIRLPEDVLSDLDEIVEELKRDPMIRAERSALIRSFIIEGIAKLKSEKAKKK